MCAWERWVVFGCVAWIIFFLYKTVVLVRWLTSERRAEDEDDDDFEEMQDSHAEHL